MCLMIDRLGVNQENAASLGADQTISPVRVVHSSGSHKFCINTISGDIAQVVRAQHS